MTDRSRLLFLMCIIALMLHPGILLVYAQDSSLHVDEDCYWVNIGSGWSWDPEDLGGVSGGWSAPSVCMGLYYQDGGNLFSTRALAAQRLWGPETLGDLSFLYGRCARASYGFVAISCGIGIVGDSRAHPAVGIPIEGQLVWTLGSNVGIGAYGFANFNKLKSFVGASICLQIGKLR